jgi:AraC family transcriptional regulator
MFRLSRWTAAARLKQFLMRDTTDSICEALEFIERNLKAEISIANIAAAVCYSLYHFCRTFNRIVHHTPYDYLIRRRLTESIKELTQTDRKIVDIALAYRFNNHETYSRAFKRMFWIQPSECRAARGIDRRFHLAPVTKAHLHQMHRGNGLRPTLVNREPLHLAGLVSRVKDEKSIPQLWRLLQSEIKESQKSGKTYGVTSYPEDWEANGRFYMAAIEVEAPIISSPALVMKTLPSAVHALFIHQGRREELHLTRDYIYQTWLPKSGYRLPGLLELEGYHEGVGTNQPQEIELYIPLIT